MVTVARAGAVRGGGDQDEQAGEAAVGRQGPVVAS
jgi:hypothetical protein